MSGASGEKPLGVGTQAGADLTVTVVGVAEGPGAELQGSERLRRVASLSRGCRLLEPLYN